MVHNRKDLKMYGTAEMKVWGFQGVGVRGKSPLRPMVFFFFFKTSEI